MTDVERLPAGTLDAAPGPPPRPIQVVPLRGLPIVAAAYSISAGMIAFAFIRDHTRGAPLALVLVMLVIYALDVPLIIAFTVARYASPPGTE
jgi:hypothetical protein